MNKENEKNLDPDGWFRLTNLGKENCLRMIEGTNPSELGYSMAEAALILWAFTKTCRDALEKDSSLEDSLREEIINTIEKAEGLWKTYREAAGLTNELPF